MSCAATRSADSGRRSLLTRLDGYRRQMCNDELFDEPEHRMRRTLASHIGPHAPLPRVPCGGACGGRNDGCHEIVCKSWCVCSLSRRAPAYAVLHPVHVCVRACSIFYFRTFCGLQPKLRLLDRACIGFAAPRGVRGPVRTPVPDASVIRVDPPFFVILIVRCRRARRQLATWRLASVSQIISHRGCYTRHAAVSDSPKLARGTTQSGVLTAELLAATRSAAEWSRRRGLHRWHVVSRNTGR